MSDKLITVVLGTGRTGRESEKVANFIKKEVEKLGFKSELADVRDYPLTVTVQGNPPARWKELVVNSSGLVIVAPEYNHGYPGELKLLLDSLYGEYRHKPAGICTVSAGAAGGARVAEQLRQVLGELGLISINPIIGFAKVNELFDVSGELKDPTYYRGQVQKLCEEIDFFASRLT